MGTWASRHLGSLDDVGLREYEAILNSETPDVYEWITCKTVPPPEMHGKVLSSIIAHVKSSPLGRADLPAYARSKVASPN